MARYQKVGAVIKAALTQCEQRQGKPLRLSALAKGLNLATPAPLSLWINGQRPPPKDRVKLLAEQFFPEDADARGAFARDIEAAIADCSDPARDPFDELSEDDGRRITWGILSYGAFSELVRSRVEPSAPSSPKGFLVALFKRFLNFAALPHIEDSEVPEVPFESVARELEQGAVDILLGQMATVDRARHQRFFATPIRIPINAVHHADFLSWRSASRQVRPGDLQRALGVNSSSELRSQFLPIIQEQEVGGHYVLRALDYQRDDYRSLPFGHHAKYAAALEQPDAYERLPVAVVDEYTCSKIINEMKGCGRFAFPVAGCTPKASDSEPRHESLPVYAVGLTVSRQHRHWIEYLEEGLGLFLAADVQYLGQKYHALFLKLRVDFKETLLATGADGKQAEKDADGWARSVLGLIPRQLEEVPRPWQPIVKKANDMIGSTT